MIPYLVNFFTQEIVVNSIKYLLNRTFLLVKKMSLCTKFMHLVYLNIYLYIYFFIYFYGSASSLLMCLKCILDLASDLLPVSRKTIPYTLHKRTFGWTEFTEQSLINGSSIGNPLPLLVNGFGKTDREGTLTVRVTNLHNCTNQPIWVVRWSPFPTSPVLFIFKNKEKFTEYFF